MHVEHDIKLSGFTNLMFVTRCSQGRSLSTINHIHRVVDDDLEIYRPAANMWNKQPMTKTGGGRRDEAS